MAKTLVTLIGSIFVFSACSKNVTYSGKVHSKHHVPVPHQKIIFTFGHGGKEQDSGISETSTDSNGEFLLSRTMERDGFCNSVTISGDSGYFRAEKVGSTSVKDWEITLK